MKTTLDRVDELVSELKPLLPLSNEDKLRLDKKIRLEFNYNSNHLEGNTLTYGETELLLIFDDTKGNHTLREYEEMKAHDVAYKLIEEWAKDKERPLTEQNIKNLNEIILVRPFWKDAVTPDGQKTRREITIGNYKQYPNSVRLANGEIFHYATPIDTPVLMQELMEWYRAEENGLHPVTLAAMMHYKFVCIHPFDDGNGRVSRLIMNYILLRNGLPPAIIKSADKANYLNALHLADVGDFEPFISYIAEQVIWSLELSLKAAKGESVEEPDDVDKRIQLLKKKLNNPDVVTEVKSLHSTNVVLSQSLFPLFQQLEEKLTKLVDLFHSTDRRMQYNELGKTYQLGNNESNFENIRQNWLAQRDLTGLSAFTEGIDPSGLSEFNYTYQLKGFKKSLALQYVSIYISAHFYEFDYAVRINNDHSGEKKFGYSHPIDKRIINEIVRSQVDKVLKQIAEASGIQE